MTSDMRGNTGASSSRTRILSSRQTKASAFPAISAGSTKPGSKPGGEFSNTIPAILAGCDGTSCRLAQEAFVLADHRQLDELRAIMIGRREAHSVAAHVEIADLLHRIDEPLARQVGPGASQPLDQDFRGDETFEAGEGEVLLAGRGFEELLILLDHTRREIPRERHNLRDAYATARGAALVRERLAADERDVQELRVVILGAHRLDEGSAGLV